MTGVILGGVLGGLTIWPPRVAASDPAPPAVRLGDDVRPVRYAVELTIEPARPDFHGRISIEAAVARPTRVVWLNATVLVITRASLDGRPARVIDGGEDFAGLTLDADLPAGPLAIEVEYTGEIDHERSRGIYAVREGDQTYAYTLFEATEARRAFPCFDQPDAKVPWRLTFHVAQDHVALANAAVESETAEPGGMKKVVIAESRPLPSYLVAFIVGPFDVIDAGTAGRAGTPLRFIVPRGRGNELGYARRVTPKVVAALEDYFDMDYPYGRLDVAVVPRYQGTMEHPGLLAMGQSLTLIAPAEETRVRREAYARILAHELSHYWFGDLVTMTWWDDTWLNEALGEWMDAIITDRAEPDWRLLERRRPQRAAKAMAADELSSPNLIHQPVETKQAIEASFDDAITYMKGSTVLHMFASWIGDDAWRRFLRTYVRAYAWRNASAEDFLGVMATELGAPAASAFRTFLDQPGLPLIEHRLACDGPPRLALHQRRALPAGTADAAVRTWHVPVCVRYGVGATVHRTCTLVTEADATLPLEGACPAWLVMNAGADGYYRSRYSSGELGAIFGRGMAARTTMIERRMVASDVAAAVARDELGIAEAMALVPRLLADPDERLRAAAGVLTEPLRADALDDATHERYRRWVLATYGPTARKLGWHRRKGDSDDRQAQRAIVLPLAAWAGDRLLAAEAGRLARKWLIDARALDDDLIEAVLGAAAQDGDKILFDALLAAARREPDRNRQRRLLAPLGAFRDPVLETRALDLLLDPALDPRETGSILIRAASLRETRERAWRFGQDHIDALLGRMRREDAIGLLLAVGATFCDAPHRGAVADLLSARAAAIGGMEHALQQTLAAIDRCIAVQSRLAPSAAKLLR
jgi:aminopeptidase N